MVRLVVHPAKKKLEVFAGMTSVVPQDGAISAPSLGLVLRIDGTALRIRDGADTYAIDL